MIMKKTFGLDLGLDFENQKIEQEFLDSRKSLVKKYGIVNFNFSIYIVSHY